MKKLIINADDFGISEGISKGIVDAANFGTVLSTSLMSNMPYAEKAIAMAEDYPQLGIGIHLNITCGSPLSEKEKVKTLLDHAGKFKSLGKFLRDYVMGLISWLEVKREYSLQIKKMIDFGMQPTHLDSHHHIHFFPGINRIVCELASEHNIPWIRGSLSGVQSCFSPHLGFHLSSFLKLSMLNHFDKKNREHTPQQCHKVDKLSGLLASKKGKFFEYFDNSLKRINGEIIEFVSHPGYVDQAVFNQDPWTEMREEELKVLTSKQVTETAKKYGFEFTNFTGIS